MFRPSIERKGLNMKGKQATLWNGPFGSDFDFQISSAFLFGSARD